MRYSSLAALLLLFWAGTAFAQAKSDCGDSSIHYEAGDGRTQEEALRAMDRALFDALNRYDDCMEEDAQSSGGGQNASGGGAGAGTGGSGSGSGSSGSVNSAAATEIEGTETPKETIAPIASSEEAEGQEGEVKQAMPKTLPNGKVPDDIPSTNNDDILQKKVREAAENEPDPEKRERLWEEYRKLKGLPSSK